MHTAGVAVLLLLGASRFAAQAPQHLTPLSNAHGPESRSESGIAQRRCPLVACSLAWSQGTATWTLTQDLVLGEVEGPRAFAEIVGLEIGPKGELIVLEFNRREIRVFQADGSSGRSIGRAGSGPGEFAIPTTIGWKGDTLWIVDAGNNRISMFRSATTHVGDISMVSWQPFSRTYSPPRAQALLRDGTLLAASTIPASIQGQGVSGGRLVLRVSYDGVVLDTLVRFSSADNVTARVALRSGRGVSFRNPISHARLLRVAADGRSMVVVEREPAGERRGQYLVAKVALNGDTLVARRVDYLPKRLTRRDAEHLVSSLAESIASRHQLARASVTEDMLSQLEVPRSHSPVSDLIAGRDGSLWVRREEVADSATVQWDVFDDRLTPLARVHAPADLKVLAASPEFVWGTRTTASGIPQIIRYRVVRRPS